MLDFKVAPGEITGAKLLEWVNANGSQIVGDATVKPEMVFTYVGHSVNHTTHTYECKVGECSYIEIDIFVDGHTPYYVEAFYAG